MKTTLSFVTLFLSISILNAQQFFKESTKTAYLMYSRHFSTKYYVDSGTTNLIARKMNFALEGGLILNKKINKKISYQTGFNVHLHFIDEVTYGVSGNLPAFTTGYEYLYNQYLKGAEYIERVSLSIPLNLKHLISKNKNYKFSVYCGPTITTYFKARDELIRLWIIHGPSRNTDTLKHIILRDFNTKRVIKGLNISLPQVEWDLGFETERNLKKYGAIVVGIKAHVGVKKLETANFTIWPDYPNLRSKGHFTLNRSYIGVYAGLRFGKNKFSKE